jgi:hypothetical protein
VDLDGILEDRLRERVQHAAAEHGHHDPQHDVATLPDIQTGPREVHDDAEVGELEGQPHVGPSRQPLKRLAGPFGQVEDDRIDVDHR